MRTLSYLMAFCSLGFSSVGYARPEPNPPQGPGSHPSEYQRPHDYHSQGHHPQGRPSHAGPVHQGYPGAGKPQHGAVGVVRIVNDFPYSLSVFEGAKLVAKLPPRGHRDLRLKPGHRPLSYRVGGSQARFEVDVHVHPHRHETLYLGERHPSYQPPRPPPMHHHAPPVHSGHGHRH